MDYLAHYESLLGGITLASDGEALTGLWFDGQKYFADTLSLPHIDCPTLSVFFDTRHWLDIYFCGKVPHFTPHLSPRGSDFRQAVWRQLLAIPYGQTQTYGDIARQLGCRSAQAIGNAVGHNSIALIIPCHRVLGADGRLTGYAAGLDRKSRLLQMEGCLPCMGSLYETL